MFHPFLPQGVFAIVGLIVFVVLALIAGLAFLASLVANTFRDGPRIPR